MARRKILPETTERRILDAFSHGSSGALFRKTSCGVCFAHGISDYNGHYGIREVCDICPAIQIDRCARAHEMPTVGAISSLAQHVGEVRVTELTERAAILEGFSEQQRYFLQHAFGFQFHDVSKPHNYGRHGRAEIGWEHVKSAHS